MKFTCLHRYWDELFHLVRVHSIPLGCDSSVHCKDVFVEENDPFIEANDAAMAMTKRFKVSLPTQVPGQNFSPRKGQPQSRGYESSDDATLQCLTRVAMSNNPPHITPQTLL
ncbi:hypothetical protein E2C01_038358 [Portunus trituberculatus]|uniref:Uncharacterized protein n=1 Tax=Portunus trituberculatus TaxID=210409 RepID=A0A5B7FAM7_PORTR|nr:hypothetical protein [Portunus trituberculatus]